MRISDWSSDVCSSDLEVPDLDEARKFYETFGLDVRDEAGGLGLYTFDHPHRWGLVTAGSAKRLRYLSFGIFEDDIDAFDKHLGNLGAKRIPAPSGAEDNGIWIEGFDGLPLNIRVAEKASPSAKSRFEATSVGPGLAGTIANSKAPKVNPRYLSHFALFTTDVSGAIDYYEKTRSEEHTSELQSLMRIPYAVFCLKKKKN